MDEPDAGAAPAGGWRWVGWVLTVVAVTAWFTYLYLYGPKPPRNVPILEGTGLSRPADLGWKLRDLEGRATTLERYRGRTIFLNIWATWCPPCVGEMPAIARL